MAKKVKETEIDLKEDLIVEKYKYMHSMDCILYNVKCKCGNVSAGWTPKEAETRHAEHECKKDDNE